NHTSTTHNYTPSLHDALPIYWFQLPATSNPEPDSGAVEEIPTYGLPSAGVGARSTVKTSPVPTPRTQDATRSVVTAADPCGGQRSEEHTSELQSRFDLVCCLL